MYEPAEDSYALEEEIIKYCQNRNINLALDMGTGSGILANTLAKYCDEVVACDINEDTLKKAKQKLKNSASSISFVHSDLFSNIDNKDLFDIIVFNPPYLREDEFGSDMELTGGKEGVEVTIEFIRQAVNFLSEDGVIFFVASSLANIDLLEKSLKNYFYFEVIKSVNLNFEVLYVYKCTFGNNLSDKVEVNNDLLS